MSCDKGSKSLGVGGQVIVIEGNVRDGEFSRIVGRRQSRLKPLTGFWISTVALGTTAPDGSTTVPVTGAELPPDCALALPPNARANKAQPEKPREAASRKKPA